MSEATVYTAADLRVGLKVDYEREIAEEDVLTFARLSGDMNPLHVDAEYARASNYEGRIAHGAFQVGLASALLGMRLPGQNVLLGSISSRFPAPLYFPSRIRVSGEITSWNYQTCGGQLKVTIQEAASLSPTAEIFMGFTLHERRSPPENRVEDTVANPGVGAPRTDVRKLVLVTGAAGGLGTAIVSSLAKEYEVVAIVNRQSLDEVARGLPRVEQIRADISHEAFSDQLGLLIGSRTIYGVVHAAWPGAPRGGLLQADTDLIDNQVLFGTTTTVRLARLLFEHASEDGGRFIALGSTAGSFKPYLPMAVYSLGKACLENTVRLLAPELARKKITINVACPSLVPVGINKQANQRQLLIEAANTPMGRLCQPDDVVQMIRYLLSPEASFVSGQLFALTGAQL